jgi:hypothetical protein
MVMLMRLTLVFFAIMPGLASAETMDQNAKVVVWKEFQLSASQLSNILNTAMKPYPVSLLSVDRNMNSYLVPLMSLGTETSTIRRVSFVLTASGKDYSVNCEMIVGFMNQDEVLVRNCKSNTRAVQISDFTFRFSDYATLK